MSEKEVVPDPHELEYDDRRQCGQRHGQDDLVKDLEVRSAIDPGRFLDLARQGPIEVSHEQNDPRDSPGGVEQDQAEEAADEAEPDHEIVDRDGHHHLGDGHEQDDGEEDVVPRGGVKAGEPIARQSANEHWDDRRRECDQKRVPQTQRQRAALIVPCCDEVLEGDGEGRHMPPAEARLT